MGAKEIVALILCLGIWLPIDWGLWLYRKRKSKAIDLGLQAYATLCALLGIWIGVSWFGANFPLLGDLSSWVLGLLPGVGVLLLLELLMPGKVRKDLTWQHVGVQVLRYLIPVGLLEEVWFRGIWFACFPDSFLLSIVLGSFVFGLVHLGHYIPDVRKGIPDVIVITIITMPFACARYNGASIVPLAIGHCLTDLFFHTIVGERKPRFGGVATIGLGIGGCALLTAVTFLW
jgi:hypothetical protein